MLRISLVPVDVSDVLLSLGYVCITCILVILLCQGEDLGPLELKIATFQDQISKSVDQCAQMQNFWLRQQNELVKKTQEADEQTKDIQTLQKQQLILTQKRMRIDGWLGMLQVLVLCYVSAGLCM